MLLLFSGAAGVDMSGCVRLLLLDGCQHDKEGVLLLPDECLLLVKCQHDWVGIAAVLEGVSPVA